MYLCRPLAIACQVMDIRFVGLAGVVTLQQFLAQEERVDDRVYLHELSSTNERPAVVKALRGVDELIRKRHGTPLNRYAVQFMGVSVALDDIPGMFLQDVWVSIPRQKITMLFSETGSGMSLFLRAIIGQIKLRTGSLLLTARGTIAYCSQRPFIPNTTILEVIIGQNIYDPEWLRTVIYICALDADLARLPSGELTLTGINGCNLNGGQKRRLVSMQTPQSDSTPIHL